MHHFSIESSMVYGVKRLELQIGEREIERDE